LIHQTRVAYGDALHQAEALNHEVA
jgi:hypothetical protein